MTQNHPLPDVRVRAILFPLVLLAATIAWAQTPIVQPGAPGEPSRLISAEEAIRLAGIRHSAADARFMRDMIPHHQQALDMAGLVAARTARNEMIELAQRIETSQADEIGFMERWLADRGEAQPDRDWRAHVHDGEHGAMHTMQGMASVAQMAQLSAAAGDEFDSLFLELMIAHHQGALDMVEELLEQEGAAGDPVLFEFTTDIKNDQRAEIERMTAMLAGYSPDPRAGLAPGFRDAGEAIWNLGLIAALPKPDGFFDPANPAALPLQRLRTLEDDGDIATEADADPDAEPAELDDNAGDSERPALLDFANTDMAFFGEVLVVGSYHGFNVYRLDEQGVPVLTSSVVCPGGQGDVSIVGDLLIMSVEQTSARVDCGLKGVVGKVSDERFRGLRIFDISDLTRPVQVGQVQTCRGSHTHTVVASNAERIIVYNAATSSVRDDEELAGCSDQLPHYDEGTALFRIDVIEIPVDRPHEARIIDSPAVFADPESGRLAGLWAGGDHGPQTQKTYETNHCHDITVFPELGIAAGACSGNGILFDIADPVRPVRLDAVVDPGFAYWHSATFSNDGTKVVFTDEWGGGTRPRCRASDPRGWGANAIFEITDGKLIFGSYYKMPAPQSEQENCVAHNGSIVPVPGRDIMVQAWYQGGISVFDFTDPARPVEIAFFDRGPIDAEDLVTGGYWSAYWYRGRVYGTEIVRGLDVFELLPSEFLSANEVAAARLADIGPVFNPQRQYPVRWPAEPVVARAYLDQLERADALPADQRGAVEALLARAEATSSPGITAELAAEFQAMAAHLNEQAREREGPTRRRLVGLADIFDAMAASQRQ